jgi:FAD/FMN-containing dehydrogenase/Fe-S oxidoreductase
MVWMEPTETPATRLRLPRPREIPFNYTSADDRQAVDWLLGPEVVRLLDELRSRRVTGRSARLLMRILGGILIHRRNPYLFQELLDSATRRRRFFGQAERDLAIIEQNAAGETRVFTVLRACRDLLAGFRAEVAETPQLRRRLQRELGAVVGSQNVWFDPFTLVSHSTDATDWRLHLPVAVVTPDDEKQVAPLLVAISRLGLKAVPRGAGTGLTGGAVPLRPGCVVINTEKLNRIRGIHTRAFQLEDGRIQTAPALEVEAGVITEKAMECAGEAGLVFATDPTSSWACSIGGNIAENAGGKHAVRWGTCIDNLVEWRMAMPSGKRWTVRRTDHRLRKILPQDRVSFEVLEEDGALVKRIELRGSEIRKNGLWKDITNKALGGVPGLQKEGTDGVITSAVFVLYPQYESRKTLCLEFFGPDMDEASHVIVELARVFPFPADGQEALLALEHFDDEYVRAIGYKVKAARAETPKAVLLIDVAGHSEEAASRGVEKIARLLERHPNTALFAARDAAEAKRFWLDRKKMGAIARRTNAFKLNEDVVIPLDALAEFARFVDRINIEEERYWQLQFLERAEEIFRGLNASEEAEQLAAKISAALQLCSRLRDWLQAANEKALRSESILKDLRHRLTELARGYPGVLAALEGGYKEVRNRRIVVATHMHAGDGNVHVNIPVLSNDRAMLERADKVIDKVMDKVIELGGVVSGEHGIGITKLKYLERERLEELSAYRAEVDPAGMMNPGKLEDLRALNHIFTPSFNLLELEARILKHGQLEELSKKIAHCVRCGKCKPDCCVYYPAAGMFYHPRNKNLAIGSLIEALLYDAQRERSTHFELLRWLEDVADHCTICHKCLKPCPVDIDSGDVSIVEREILASWGYKRTPALTKLTLGYLDSRSPEYNKLFHASVVRLGGAIQRAASRVAAPWQPAEAGSSFYPLTLLRSAVAPASAETLRDALPSCEADQVLVFEPENATPKTVFYFPGCGSERLQASISMAAVHLLGEAGTRVVLAPSFLCCGFPARANARSELYSRITLRDTILFSQIREMFSHYEFDACVVTCGTCREGLEAMEAETLFGGRIEDVSRYVLQSGLRVTAGADGGDGPKASPDSGEALYHAPCHDSLDGSAAELLANAGMGKLNSVPHCCSEAGTLALSRPDITDAMLHRKREALAKAMAGGKPAAVLTNCPSCVQGLGRNRGMGVKPVHLTVALAEKHSGPNWMERFRAQAARARAFSF